jgi:hypothetical protein
MSGQGPSGGRSPSGQGAGALEGASSNGHHHPYRLHRQSRPGGAGRPGGPAHRSICRFIRRSIRWLVALGFRHPWRYAAIWAAVVASGNLGLRVLLTDQPMSVAVLSAALTGVVLFLATGLLIRWRVRALPRQRAGTGRLDEDPPGPGSDRRNR